jgi:chromosomal replication initiator protein
MNQQANQTDIPAVGMPAELHRAIVARIGEPRFQMWFKPFRTRFTLSEDGLTVGVANLHLQEFLGKTFQDTIRSAVADVLGQPLPVRFVIDPEMFRAARAEEAAVQAEAASEPIPAAPAPAPVTREVSVEVPAAAARKPARRWRALGEFVVAACNRVAYAAAQSMVEEPGAGVNPLVLHGPVGTGKTHLLEGVYAGLRRSRPEWRVIFNTAEDFTNRFVQAMRFDKLSGFRRYFRDCDVLLLDDLHFLARKKATQEEFLHTFDALLADGRPVVVTCDCHPRLSEEFLPELADRLLGGGVWGLVPPDAEARLAILSAKRGTASPHVPDEVLEFLARHLRGNVRELEGALHSVRHYGRATGRRIDLALAREALGELLRHAVRVVQVADVDRAVCASLQLPKGALQSKQRSWAVSHPRMLAIYLCRKHTAAAYSEISVHFGGKTHSTAVAAEKKVRQWLAENAEMTLGERSWRVRDLIDRVERELSR